ncbi:hypothetical protein [Pantoea septica]|uniref:hypothetical protein n=1 Tax=Pantoea septica TaxID=472695 RepID=UPI0023F6F9DB|nr:hypothetical protein [Pantoea septica]
MCEKISMAQDETERRIAACVNAFEGIPTDRIEGKDLGEILAGEVRLHGAGPRADGGFGFEFSGGICQLMVEAYAEQFRQSGAINYLELLFNHSDIGPLTITMQRVEGLTPAQKLAQAEAQRDSLQQKLDALAAEAAYLRNEIKQHSQSTHFCEVCGKDDPCHTDDVCRALSHPIPATEDILNQVRAEGAEMLAAKHQRIIDIVNGDSLFGDLERGHAAIAAAAIHFAAQLRAGKDGE